MRASSKIGFVLVISGVVAILTLSLGHRVEGENSWTPEVNVNVDNIEQQAVLGAAQLSLEELIQFETSPLKEHPEELTLRFSPIKGSVFLYRMAGGPSDKTGSLLEGAQGYPVTQNLMTVQIENVDAEQGVFTQTMRISPITAVSATGGMQLVESLIPEITTKRNFRGQILEEKEVSQPKIEIFGMVFHTTPEQEKLHPMFSLPEKSLKVGDSWQNKSEVNPENLYDSRVADFVEWRGHKCVVIERMLNMTGEASFVDKNDEQNRVPMVMKRMEKSTLYFDYETGLLVREDTVSGQSIDYKKAFGFFPAGPTPMTWTRTIRQLE